MPMRRAKPATDVVCQLTWPRARAARIRLLDAAAAETRADQGFSAQDIDSSCYATRPRGSTQRRRSVCVSVKRTFQTQNSYTSRCLPLRLPSWTHIVSRLAEAERCRDGAGYLLPSISMRRGSAQSCHCRDTFRACHLPIRSAGRTGNGAPGLATRF